MLNEELKVQECDATMSNRISVAGNKKTILVSTELNRVTAVRN